MKIRKLHLKNIGVFDDETIEFKECPVKDKAEIHILTGENGTGKTTILMALASSFDYFTTGNLRPLSNNLQKRFRFKEKEFTGFVTAIDDGNPISHYKSAVSGDEYSKLANLSKTSYVDDFAEMAEITESSFTSSLTFNHWANLVFKHPAMDEIGLAFAVFAFSGYRQIKNEQVQAIKELPKFNPLYQSLEFVKDYSQGNNLTINQLVANNISNRALSKEDGSLEEAKKYETVINSIETFIKDVTDYEVKFVLKRSPNELKLKMHGEELDFDVLPDGLRSLISWIADLLGRVDLLKWQDDLPITEKNLILLLDEIEVHLHPAWQRKVLPVVQKLFKNAQIFVSTHSPFVVNSVDDAWVYKLKVKDGKAKVEKPYKKTENSQSITQVLREVFDIYGLFGKDVQDNIDKLEKLRDKILSNGTDLEAESEFMRIAKLLAKEPSDQIKNIVRGELEQLSEIKGKNFLI